MKYKIYLLEGITIICNGVFTKLKEDAPSSIVMVKTEGELFLPNIESPVHTGDITFSDSAVICRIKIK